MRKGFFRKKVMIAAMTVVLATVLAGCGNRIPELTDEEAKMIGEYAAVTLLKYDTNHQSRLVDEETIEAYDRRQAELAEKMAESSPEPEPEGMPPVDDTPVVDKGEDVVVQEPTASLAASISAPEGITVSYLEYEVCDTYPGDVSESYNLAVDASAGNKLLVLRFAVENNAANDVAVDFFSATNAFYVSVGDEKYVTNLTTMLLDDMATYAGTLQPGASEELVLLFEVKENVTDSIEEIELRFGNNTGTKKIEL